VICRQRDSFGLRCETLSALPIVCWFLARMRVGALLERYLPQADPRVGLPAARAIGVLVRNLCVCHEPLYQLEEWAAPFDPALLGLSADQRGLLNDDRVGRALERLFCCDRASLLTELMLGVISEFQVDCSQLHNDSTSISLHGEYLSADGREQHGKATVAIVKGHSKDRRPDLKQLIWILTVAADQALPLAYRLADGNTNDDLTHIDTWEGLCALSGRTDFLYIADSKLATRPQMSHIDARGGRFITLLPKSRKEDRQLRDWMREHQPQFSEAARRPAARKGQPDELWSTAPAPIRSAEGYRIIWVHSTKEQRRDQHIRSERLARAQTALGALNNRLHGPKCRFADRETVQAAADAILAHDNATELIATEIIDRGVEPIVSQTRTADGTIYRKRTTRKRFTLAWTIAHDALARDAAADGCFPLITNENQLTNPQILAAYRYQPHLEKRHHQLKSIQHAAPIYLKSPARIEALFLCHYLALLCSALIERQLRQAMTRQNITQLPLYPEQRRCTNPTSTRTLHTFANLTRHHLHQNGQHIHTFPPQLTPLQQQLLHLLDLPDNTYTQ
jgi:transposase